MSEKLDIIIAGVGGQGVILMSELLGNAAVKDGLNVRGSEILGMAVRGGSVLSTIRIGDGVFGPLTPMGQGDILVSMEPTEALRNVTYLSASGLVIMNLDIVIPFTVALGKSNYPSLEVITEKLNSVTEGIVTVNATEAAIEVGSRLAANIVMLGALFGTGQVPIKQATVKGEIENRFAAKLVPMNLKAFDIGFQMYQKRFK
ncbi:indolepyruvate oxidoreductase subunit beta [Chloroflexota bacterium]